MSFPTLGAYREPGATGGLSAGAPPPAATRLRAVLLLALALGLTTTSACTDPKFREAQAVRGARVKHQLDAYAKHDAAGKERIADLLRRAEQAERDRRNQLADASAKMTRQYQTELRRWSEEEKKRQARLKDILNGSPKDIPKTSVRIVY
ncbi:MAG: hypothetical protein AABZ12_14115 [Planctomycetota bacterium]